MVHQNLQLAFSSMPQGEKPLVTELTRGGTARGLIPPQNSSEFSLKTRQRRSPPGAGLACDEPGSAEESVNSQLVRSETGENCLFTSCSFLSHSFRGMGHQQDLTRKGCTPAVARGRWPSIRLPWTSRLFARLWPSSGPC